MKIALIGYGRMGRLIEQVALKHGHKICCIIDVNEVEKFESKEFREADVAIEFSAPTAAADNVMRSFAAGVPVVSGTTGWGDSLPAMKMLCDEGKGTLMHSSNFSIGVTVLRAVNRYLTRIMRNFPHYTPSLQEVHHVHKLDHPSGTAVTLADELIAEDPDLTGWEEAPADAGMAADKLKITSIREGEVPGVHTVSWESPEDVIVLGHSAKGRGGFAEGAVKAAEWLAGRKGWHTLSEMFSDITGTTGVF